MHNTLLLLLLTLPRQLDGSRPPKKGGRKRGRGVMLGKTEGRKKRGRDKGRNGGKGVP